MFLEKSNRIEAITFLYFVALMVISLIERAVRKQMAAESISDLPILPQNMRTASPTWNNLRYLFRNIHLSQIFINDHLIKQTLKGLHDIHIEVLRLWASLHPHISNFQWRPKHNPQIKAILIDNF
ncbi:MAG: hypothetical protein R2875_14850 [Desulfobacterales bacterium]